MKRIFFYLIFLIILAGCDQRTILPNPEIALPAFTAFPTHTAQIFNTSLPPKETPTPIDIPATATPTSIPSLRFAIIGDYGLAGEPLAAVAYLVNSWLPDFILTTGDNNYPLGEASTIDTNIGQYFHQYIYPYNGDYGEGSTVNRFFPTLGNHDWYSNDAEAYLEYFTLPGNERYYQFSWDFIDFFAIDSDWSEPDGNRENSVQGEWLKNALAQSNAQWKIVTIHHPPFASGTREPMLVNRWPYQEWGADIVIADHDHHYERLIINDFPYFVNGLGGGGLYDIGEIISGSEVRFRGNWGAQLVEATTFEITLTFITIDGEMIDSFTINK